MNLNKNWSFGGITFARVVSGEFPEWFEESTAYQVDTVLDGPRYLDIGGPTLAPLPIRATTDVVADREALIALRSQEGDLESPKGHTATAVLIKAVRVFVAPGLYAADLEFEQTY